MVNFGRDLALPFLIAVAVVVAKALALISLV